MVTNLSKEFYGKLYSTKRDDQKNWKLIREKVSKSTSNEVNDQQLQKRSLLCGIPHSS